MDKTLPPPVPVPDPGSAGYWAALAAGQLAICRCTECRQWMQPPQETCRRCGGATAFEAVSGSGSIFSFIVVRHQSLPGLVPPYAVAIIELDEQPALRLSGVVEADPATVAIGQHVRAVIRPIGDSEFSAPAWQPA